MLAFPWELAFVALVFALVLGGLALTTRGREGRSLRLGALIAAGLTAVFVVGAFAAGTPVDVSGRPFDTSAAAPPVLQPRTYSLPPPEVYKQAVLAASAQQSWGRPWRVVAQAPSPSGGTLQIAVPGLVWSDVLVVRIRPEERGIQVDVTARSPLGPLALGAPQRHTARFLRALDERLAAP